MMTLEIAKFETPTREPFFLFSFFFFLTGMWKDFHITTHNMRRVDVLQEREIIAYCFSPAEILQAGTVKGITGYHAAWRVGGRRSEVHVSVSLFL